MRGTAWCSTIQRPAARCHQRSLLCSGKTASRGAAATSRASSGQRMLVMLRARMVEAPLIVPAQIIDGKAVARSVEAEVAAAVARLGFAPGLSVVRVGNDPASEIYVRSKARKAQELGFRGSERILPETTSEEELLEEVRRLNADEEVDGILVQLPLPKQIAPAKVIETIDPAKDVDGFHPRNVGLLHLGRPTLVPCTPAGAIRLIESTGTAIEGKHAVVIGRSDIVG